MQSRGAGGAALGRGEACRPGQGEARLRGAVGLKGIPVAVLLRKADGTQKGFAARGRGSGRDLCPWQ